MAYIYNYYNINFFQSIFFPNLPLQKKNNLLDNFNIIQYKGITVPKVKLEPNNPKKLEQLIYWPLEDIKYKDIKKNEYNNYIDNKIRIEENQRTMNFIVNTKTNENNNENNKLFLNNHKKIFYQKNNNFNCENDENYVKDKNSIKPIPPENIIKILNEKQTKNIDYQSNNFENINKIILDNIDLLNYNNDKLTENNKIDNPRIINQINNNTINKFNLNFFTNTFFNENQNQSSIIQDEIKESKPIFEICFKSSNEEYEEGKRKNRRGRKSEKIKKNYRIHSASDDDNLKRKIQVHFLSFVIDYANDIIRAFIKVKILPIFKKLDYQIKKIVNNKFLQKIKAQNISEVLQLEISPKLKTYDKNINKNTFLKISNMCPFLADFFQKKSYLDLFKEYYLDKNKIFNVNGIAVQLSLNTKTFKDLLNKNNKHKNKLKYIAIKNFINDYKKSIK